MSNSRFKPLCYSSVTGEFSSPQAPLTWLVIAVEDAEGEERTISVCCKRSLSQSCQVIHVIKGRTFMVVIASQEKVDMVRGLQPETRFSLKQTHTNL